MEKPKIQSVMREPGIRWYIVELRNRLNHFYLQTDGTYKFPNSAEGDLLKMFEKFLTLAVEKFNN